MPNGLTGAARITFRISILASGSSGNSTLLETGRTTLLVDAGFGRKEMVRRFEALGRARPEHVDAILLTHEHTDHCNGLAQLARDWDCPAYLTEPTHREIKKMFAGMPTKAPGRVEYVRPGIKFEIGDIEVAPFSIPHDAADPVGFAFRAGRAKVAIVTDLGYLPELVKHHLRDADFLILESNHDLDMLKVGPYPWVVKQRVLSRTGHLSNHAVSEFLADPEGFDSHARYLVLAHISQENNNPHTATITAQEALDRRPSEQAFRGELLLASQHEPLKPLHL